MLASLSVIRGLFTAQVATKAARRAALGILCLGIAGCASGMQMGPGGGTPPALTPTSAMRFCDNADPNCTAATAFTLASLRDLNVFVDWQLVPEGTHAQTIQIFVPNGSLYQSFEKSFVVPAGAAGVTTTVQALPVAGTWITQRSLTGSWQVTLTLDGQAMSTQTVQFTQ
jgi:hypothetical protein